MNDEHLRTYMDDHYAGSVAAVELIEHYIKTHPDTPRSDLLQELLGEIKADQAILLDLLQRVGGKESSIKDAAAWLVDKLSRTKLNEMTKNRTLSEFEKLEELVLGVRGKLALWAALGTVSASDERFNDVDFEHLKQRAQQQMERLEEQRLEAARAAFLEIEETKKRE